MISDPDLHQWKALRPKCIDCYCQETLKLVRQLIDIDDPPYDQHRKLNLLVSSRDTELTQKFDPHPRSIKWQLLNLYRDVLITDSDLDLFSEELCAYLRKSKVGLCLVK